MPGTTWPVDGYPPGSSRDYWGIPVSMPFPGLDTSSAVRSRSSSRSPPDASTCAFSSSLTTTVSNQRSMRRFGISPRRATPRGQSLIFCTAPRSAALLPQAASHVRGTPQLPRVPSLIPRSRATSAIGRPEWTTNSTASALYSWVYFRRAEPTAIPLLVDRRTTWCGVYGSGRSSVCVRAGRGAWQMRDRAAGRAQAARTPATHACSSHQPTDQPGQPGFHKPTPTAVCRERIVSSTALESSGTARGRRACRVPGRPCSSSR
jgi:hypothetical protein